MNLRAVEPAMSGQPEPQPDQLQAVANKLRTSLIERSADHSTDPTQADLDKMLQVIDILEERGSDPALFLERWMKLLFITGDTVLSRKQMDALVERVIGLDHVAA